MPEQEDMKPLGVNLSTVGRFGAGGALTGASLASALTLVKMIRDMSEAKKERNHVDDHTLTLTLPAKEAKAKDKEPKVKMDKSKATEKPATTPRQIRSTDGKYNIKTANWQTMASALLAMGAGGGLGFTLVNKVYEHKKQRELESQLGSAKQEYLDMLMGPKPNDATKIASERGDASFSYLDYPMGLGALALLLGSGSTAWLTKKIVDEYNKEPKSEYRPVRQPKIERLVFKTEGEKAASLTSDDSDVLDAALGVYLDLCSGAPDILGHEKCAEAMSGTDMTPAALYKFAADDYEQLMAYLHNNPELRTVIKRIAMDRHPVMKYLKPMVNLPGIKGYGDDKLYDSVRRIAGPQHEIFDNVKAEAAVKRADIAGTLGGLMAGSVGASAANLAFENNRKKPAGILERPEANDQEREADIDRMVNNIDLKATDEHAAEFAENNKDKIKNVLRMLAEEGKI